ncbi:MAG: cyclic nucleotide-binding domain-containing protein [Hyphomicrobiaceae bacterium]
MHGASVYSRKLHCDLQAGRGDQPAVEHLRANSDPDGRWIANAVGPLASRRCVSAQLRLFAEGDLASSYYLVETGQFLVHRRLARSTSGGPVAAVRFLSCGDLFIFNCGDMRAANCDALVDSVVLRIDRVQFQREAALNPELDHAQSAVHADELGWILRGSHSNHGINRGIVENQQPRAEFGAVA